MCAESLFGSLSGVHVSWQYRDAIKELILSAKLGSRLDRSILMGGLALENPPHNAILSRCDCVVPVPPSRARLLRVGYDTSTEFAAFIAKATDRPLFATALRRNSSTRQTQRSRIQRLTKSSKDFCAGRGQTQIRGKAVLLVDDIVTTGRTLASTSQILLSLGAKEVFGWAFAGTNRQFPIRTPPSFPASRLLV